LMETTIVKPVDIEDEMKSSYLDYAMSVIVSRALPDARYDTTVHTKRVPVLLVRYWGSTIHTEMPPYMKLWYEWLRTFL